MTRLIHACTALALLTALLGCKNDNPYPKYGTDQKLREQIFQSCLKALPAGPRSTHYNDWSEVVDSCQSAAYYHSRICLENCPAGRDVLGVD